MDLVLVLVLSEATHKQGDQIYVCEFRLEVHNKDTTVRVKK